MNEDYKDSAVDAIDSANKLISQFLEEDDETFETAIRIATQQAIRAKRSIGHTGSEAFWAGYRNGSTAVVRDLYRERLTRKEILEAIDRSNPEAKPTPSAILGHLYETGKPIKHPALAEALGVTYESLTKAMMGLLACNAVQAACTGANTTYGLTPVARRLCKKLYAEGGNPT